MKKILYMGDTHLRDAAAYLAGLMHHFGWSFEYIPSDVQPNPNHWSTEYGLYIVSDYPALNLNAADHEAILRKVAEGAGLLMIGGWESYHGVGGDWDGTPIGNAIPVEIATKDDRFNCDQPVLVRRLADHPITQGLPWETHPPVIGGFNRVNPKPGAKVLLEACVFRAKCTVEKEFEFQHSEQHPLLVVGQHHAGRVASLMTDVAPHWVGPLVDWGTPRVSAQGANANAVEVGGYYAQFFHQLLKWASL